MYLASLSMDQLIEMRDREVDAQHAFDFEEYMQCTIIYYLDEYIDDAYMISEAYERTNNEH